MRLLSVLLLFAYATPAVAQSPAPPQPPTPVPELPATDPEPIVLSVALARGLYQQDEWDGEARALALQLLAARSRYIAAYTALAIGKHPDGEFAQPLLDLVKRPLPKDDREKRAAARATELAMIAFEKCLRRADRWPADSHPYYTSAALKIGNMNAARYLWVQFRNRKIPKAQAVAAIEHLAKYGDVWLREDLVTALELHCPIPFSDAMFVLARTTAATGGKLTRHTAEIVELQAQTLLHWTPNWMVPPERDEIQRILEAARALLSLSTAAPKDFPVALPLEVAASFSEVASNAKLSPEARAAALDVLVRFAKKDGIAVGRALLTDSVVPSELRERLLVSFATYGDRDARLDARDAIKDVPYRMALAVGFGLSSTSGGAQDLLEAVKFGKAPARLLQEKAIRERLRQHDIADLEKQLATLTKGLPAPEPKLVELVKERVAAFAKAKPDKAAGEKVYAKHCAACHKIGERSKIAPQLDGIGVRGVERLLEDTLDPNRIVDQGFRARVISTKDGKTLTGLMVRVEAGSLVVIDGEGKERRIPTDDITNNRDTMLSPMAANYGDTIPEADLLNLLAYLLELKTPPKLE